MASGQLFHTPVNDFGNLDQAQVPDVRGQPAGQALQRIRSGLPDQVSPTRSARTRGHGHLHLAERRHPADSPFNTSVMVRFVEQPKWGRRPRTQARDGPALAVLG